MSLYIIRAIAHEIPYVGGRARGGRRPRAPSLAERPNGRRRTFSIGGASSGFVVDESERMGLKRRDRGGDGAIEEEEEEAVDITVEGWC